jgi:hypothetical protein
MFTVGPTFFANPYVPVGFLEDSLGYYTFALNALHPRGTAQSTSVKYSGGSSLFGYVPDNSYYSNSSTDPSFDTARLNVGTGDFTLEMRVYPTLLTSAMTLIFFDKTSSIGVYDPSWNLAMFNDGTLWFFANGGVGLDFKSSNALTLNAWNNVGISRNGTTWTLFVNGVSTTTTSSQSLNAAILKVVVGRFLRGYVDHIRLSNVARAIGVAPDVYDIGDPNALLILEFDDTV